VAKVCKTLPKVAFRSLAFGDVLPITSAHPKPPPKTPKKRLLGIQLQPPPVPNAVRRRYQDARRRGVGLQVARIQEPSAGLVSIPTIPVIENDVVTLKIPHIPFHITVLQVLVCSSTARSDWFSSDYNNGSMAATSNSMQRS